MDLGTECSSCAGSFPRRKCPRIVSAKHRGDDGGGGKHVYGARHQHCLVRHRHLLVIFDSCLSEKKELCCAICVFGDPRIGLACCSATFLQVFIEQHACVPQDGWLCLYPSKESRIHVPTYPCISSLCSSFDSKNREMFVVSELCMCMSCVDFGERRARCLHTDNYGADGNGVLHEGLQGHRPMGVFRRDVQHLFN